MPTSQDTRGEPSNHFRWTWVTTSQRVTHLPIAVSWSCTSPSLPLTALSSSGCEQLSAARPACRHSSASQELGTSYSPPRLTNSAAPAPDQKSEFRKLIPSFPDLPKVNVRLYSFKTPAQLNSSTFSCFSVLFYNNNNFSMIIRKDGLKQAGVRLQAAPHSDSKWHILWAQWDLRHESSATGITGSGSAGDFPLMSHLFVLNMTHVKAHEP